MPKIYVYTLLCSKGIHSTKYSSTLSLFTINSGPFKQFEVLWFLLGFFVVVVVFGLVCFFFLFCWVFFKQSVVFLQNRN